MIIVRYADDIVVGFEHEADARRFWDAMCKRFEEFALSLHPDKTRLIEFGRHAAARRAQRGLGKPETFKFLGFVFICARSRRGRSSSSGSLGGIASGRSSRRSRRSCDGSLLWNLSMSELPGVREDGMPGRNVQRTPGTARGSPRRSRTAKASRISHCAVKSRCACERGGWGRLSDDGPGHYNPDPSEGPWGGGLPTLQGGALSSPQARLRAVPSMRPRGARRADANRTSVSACREQA